VDVALVFILGVAIGVVFCLFWNWIADLARYKR
jgi:hypothetical protein